MSETAQRSLQMKVLINCKEYEFEEGAKFIEVVELIREAKKNEPMIKVIREKTGQDRIVFVLNGQIVQAHTYESLDLKEGDDIRWVHPYFGG
jgi:sulfur carrier protein ThiS